MHAYSKSLVKLDLFQAAVPARGVWWRRGAYGVREYSVVVCGESTNMASCGVHEYLSIHYSLKSHALSLTRIWSPSVLESESLNP